MKEIILEGGCHCGAIRYRIEGPLPESGFCHCRDCQQTSGSPAQVWMDVRVANFKLTKGTPSIYESSETGRRNFCSKCGSQLFFSSIDEPDFVFPHVGCLDDPNLVQPASHIWTDRQLDWFKLDDKLPRYARDMPEEE